MSATLYFHDTNMSICHCELLGIIGVKEKQQNDIFSHSVSY